MKVSFVKRLQKLRRLQKLMHKKVAKEFESETFFIIIRKKTTKLYKSISTKTNKKVSLLRRKTTNDLIGRRFLFDAHLKKG